MCPCSWVQCFYTIFVVKTACGFPLKLISRNQKPAYCKGAGFQFDLQDQLSTDQVAQAQAHQLERQTKVHQGRLTKPLHLSQPSHHCPPLHRLYVSCIVIHRETHSFFEQYSQRSTLFHTPFSFCYCAASLLLLHVVSSNFPHLNDHLDAMLTLLLSRQHQHTPDVGNWHCKIWIIQLNITCSTRHCSF